MWEQHCYDQQRLCKHKGLLEVEMGLFDRNGSGRSSAPVGRKGEVVDLNSLDAGDFVSDDEDADEIVADGPPEDQGEEIPNPTVDDFLVRVETDGYGGKASEIASDFLSTLAQKSQENQRLPIYDLVSEATRASKFAQDAPRTMDLMALLTTNALLEAVESDSEEPVNPYLRLRSLVAEIEEKELGVSLI